jgi:hypothetical protein
MVPDKRVTIRPGEGRTYWRQPCECTVERFEYAATDHDLAAFRDLLAQRGFPSSDRFAGGLLSSLADCGTRVVIEMPDGEVVVTAEEAIDAMGHGF